MKKYLLLAVLFIASMAMGTLVYTSAHQNTTLGSVSTETDSFYSEKTEFTQAEIRETEKATLAEGGKELAKTATNSVARFLFSLIYK